jgi:hypothetical protein
MARVTFECDRCRRTKVVEVNEGTLLTGVEPPSGWRTCYHPADAPKELIFDTRSCMSSWYATWVRVLYGGPETLPARKRGPRKVSPLRKGAKKAIEVG